MADLGRGGLASWSQAEWDKCDALAAKYFNAETVFAKVWAPRIVPPNSPSTRIGGRDVAVGELTSTEFEYSPGQQSETDWERELMSAAYQLAVQEDQACVRALRAVGHDAKLGKRGVPEFNRAEATLRGRPNGAGSAELAVFVGYELHATLDSTQFLQAKTALGHLETRFGGHLLRTLALDPIGEQEDAPQAIVTFRSPAPIEIVRTDSPRLRVVGLAGRTTTFELVLDSAVASATRPNAVYL